jgi:hypothetical protein
MHVGDLDGASTQSRSKWDASVAILVHDSNEGPVASATVFGSWSNGANGDDACVTAADGTCQITISSLNSHKTGSVTFTVTDVTQGTLAYEPLENHDLDITDSDGTTIVILKP